MSRKRRPRTPDADELETWRKVAATARPLNAMRDAVARAGKRDPAPGDAAAPATRDNASAGALPAFRPGERAGAGARSKATGHDLAASPAAALSAAPLKMDRKVFGRLKRGKGRPDGRIDLHGMRASEAQAALTRFVLAAHASDKRLLLVITGKGREDDEPGPIPRRIGVLRHEVPHWLHSPPLSQVVLQVTPAHRRHGGDGAYYVYLRRKRGQAR